MAFRSDSTNLCNGGPSFDDYLDSDDEGVMYTHMDDSSASDGENRSCFGSLKKKKSFTKVCEVDNSSEDDFEKEMAQELSSTMKKLTTPVLGGTSASVSGETADNKSKDDGFYSTIYFDSDDSDGEKYDEERKPQPKRKVLSNDELFYDPDMDEEDQEFVDSTRRQCQVENKRGKGGPLNAECPQKLPNSDAVLNCPACFTTLCLDCQRHEIYNNQYRAMFVFNCKIDFSEKLKFPKKVDKKEQRKMKWKKSKVSKTDFPLNSEDSRQGNSENSLVDNERVYKSMETSVCSSVNTGVSCDLGEVEEIITAGAMKLTSSEKCTSNSSGLVIADNLCIGSSSTSAQNVAIPTSSDFNQISCAKNYSSASSCVTSTAEIIKNLQKSTKLNPIQSIGLESDIEDLELKSANEVILGSEISKMKPTEKIDLHVGVDQTLGKGVSKLVKKVSSDLNQPRWEKKDILSGTYKRSINETMLDRSLLRSGSTEININTSLNTGVGIKEDLYHSVKCTVCNTKVAVYDEDEIYHFFSVLASY